MRFMSSSVGIFCGAESADTAGCAATLGAALATPADPRARYPTSTPTTRQTAAITYTCHAGQMAFEFATSLLAVVIPKKRLHSRFQPRRPLTLWFGRVNGHRHNHEEAFHAPKDHRWCEKKRTLH